MGCALKARCKLAGMDGNRTHPGRLSSAPQDGFEDRGGTIYGCSSTFAGGPSPDLPFNDRSPPSTVVRHVGSHLGCLGGAEYLFGYRLSIQAGYA